MVSQSTARRYELQDPDVRLMLEVRDGSAAAFDELMTRYQSRLVTVLDHLTGRRELAEDLAQEVFLRVYRARSRYVPGAKFSTWLFTIANNVASNALRTLARRPEVQVAPRDPAASGGNSLDHLALEASGLMPTRQLDKTELQEVVEQALAALNPQQRMAVLLSKFEEMSYHDIAETMQKSPQAVKSLLARARENLREALEPYLKSS
ncbi:MAG TPA: sigma-70 family RNA polymerase sigma factor [Pirellulales bacterium]